MVGIGTVLADDPMLNCRIENGIDPIRIILDSRLRIPMDSNIVKTANEIRTIIFCGIMNEDIQNEHSSEFFNKMDEIISKGIKVKQVHLKNGSVDIKEVFDEKKAQLLPVVGTDPTIATDNYIEKIAKAVKIAKDKY